MTDKFHERFNIEVPIEEARRRFVNRVHNSIAEQGWVGNIVGWEKACRGAANKLGELFSINEHFHNRTLSKLTNHEFNRTLQAIEGIRAVAGNQAYLIDEQVINLLSESELDLNLAWVNGAFLPIGARLLDEKLVNDSLAWLREQRYQTVLLPFEKALSHLLGSRSDPRLLADVVTDAFDALESLSNVIAGNDKGLDANRELFLSKVNASDEYKVFLRWYCEYAHEFRHGTRTSKPSISYAEAESFVYLAGIFIRLAISTTSPASAVVVKP
ncbi:MAG: hypothetical protein LAP85_22895 [Acidobacteriia bacterium]|nr:hypothetical protein [Terriglobia bacterium]